MNKIIYILIFFSLTLFSVAANDDLQDWRLVDKKIIYTGDENSSIKLDANSQWVKISSIKEPFIKDIPLPSDGFIRKWRVVAKYSDSDSSIKTSFQIKFMTSTFKRPTFSFTRPLGYNGDLEGFSDWFQFEDGSSKRIYDGDAAVYARIVSPPTTVNRGKIYSIELQAWDKLSEDAEVKVAAGKALPNTSLFNLNKEQLTTIEQANEFALQVMSTIFNNDEKEFAALVSDKCYSLEYGTVYYKNDFPLYSDLKEITKDTHITLASYKDNYKPQLVSFEEYSELFPHWLDEEREWKPGKNDYLFLGNMMKKSGKELIKTRMAVFMIGFDNGKWQIKAIPE